MNNIVKIKVLFSMCLLSFFSCKNENGQILEKEVVPYTLFYDNGLLKESGQLVNGYADGYYYKFLESGEKFREHFLREGKLHGVQKWYSEGKLHYTETFVNGVRDGKAVSYNPRCGYVEEEGIYENNMKEGLWYIYEKENLFMVELYKKDSLIKILYRNPQIEKKSYTLEDAPPSDDDC